MKKSRTTVPCGAMYGAIEMSYYSYRGFTPTAMYYRHYVAYTIYVLKMDIMYSRGLPPAAIIKHRYAVVMVKYSRVSGVRI